MTQDRAPERCGSVSESTTSRRWRKRAGSIAAMLVAGAGVAALSATFEASPSRAGSDPVGVMVISWDGVRYDTLKEMVHWQPIAEVPEMCPGDDDTLPRMPQACGEYWSCLPNICQFEIIESRVVAGKTLTRVQHASMLTGMTPEFTTINTNNGSSSVPYGITVYERLNTHVGDGIQFAHVGSYRYTVRGILGWVDGSIIPTENIRSRGRPDKFTGRGSNENFIPLLSKFVGTSFFAFQHQKGVDMAGHGVGDQSIQYRIAMVAADDRLKEVLDELDRLDLADHTHILITTDHGFWHNQHLGIRPNIARTWIASRSDKLLCHTRGNVVDIVPTVFDLFGVDPVRSIPHMQGRSLLDKERTGDCIPPTCGDGILEVGEDCETGQPVADTCEGLGYLRGNLTCSPTCTYDTSDCADLLALTKISIETSVNGGVDIQLRMADRDRAGADFDPVSDAIGIDVYNGGDLLWSGGTDNYDPTWRVASTSNNWTADRGAREDGLISVSMSSPVKRMKMQIDAGDVQGMGNFLELTSVRTEIRVGQERFDANLLCHPTHDELGLKCKYEKPEDRHHH